LARLLGPLRQVQVRTAHLATDPFHYQIRDPEGTILVEVMPMSSGRRSFSPSEAYPPHSHGRYRLLDESGATIGSMERDVRIVGPQGEAGISVGILPFASAEQPPRGYRVTENVLLDEQGRTRLVLSTRVGRPVSGFWELLDQGSWEPETRIPMLRTEPPSSPIWRVPPRFSLVNAKGREVGRVEHVSFAGQSFRLDFVAAEETVVPTFHLLLLLLERQAVAALGALTVGQVGMLNSVIEDTVPVP